MPTLSNLFHCVVTGFCPRTFPLKHRKSFFEITSPHFSVINSHRKNHKSNIRRKQIKELIEFQQKIMNEHVIKSHLHIVSSIIVIFVPFHERTIATATHFSNFTDHKVRFRQNSELNNTQP